MMLMGWCQVCRKFKYVRVTSTAATWQPIVVGTCSQCEDEQTQQRRPRRHP